MKSPKKYRRKRRGAARWTAREIKVLTREWHEVSERVLASMLAAVHPKGQRRRWCAIHRRALAIGLPGGIPQGYESIYAAATRTNYSWGGLLSLLRRQGVTLRKRYRSGAARSTIHSHYAAIDAIDAAIARDLKAASVGYWARERGLATNNLRQILKRRGVGKDLPPEKHLRLTREQLDAALADYRPQKRAA